VLLKGAGVLAVTRLLFYVAFD